MEEGGNEGGREEGGREGGREGRKEGERKEEGKEGGRVEMKIGGKTITISTSSILRSWLCSFQMSTLGCRRCPCIQGTERAHAYCTAHEHNWNTWNHHPTPLNWVCGC